MCAGRFLDEDDGASDAEGTEAGADPKRLSRPAEVELKVEALFLEASEATAVCETGGFGVAGGT